MNKTIVSLSFFVFGVFLFTFLDWVVNGLLYRYGLSFSQDWYGKYSMGYFLLYQFLICLLLIYSRSWRAGVLMEAFVLSSTQDFVYFIVWNGGFPVGDWSWMPLFGLLGFCDATVQSVLSFTSMLSAIVLIKIFKK